MLKSLGVPLNKNEILNDAVGFDEEDMDENMQGNEEILKVKEKIQKVKNPEIIRREDYVVYDALIRGACTHPGCDCVEFKFGVRDRRVCRTCKHKNKFHKPPKAKIGLKPTNVVVVEKHVFKDEIHENLDENESVGRRGRRAKLIAKKKQEEAEAKNTKEHQLQKESNSKDNVVVTKQEKKNDADDEKEKLEKKKRKEEKIEEYNNNITNAKQNIISEEEIKAMKITDPKKAERLEKKRERQLKRIKQMEDKKENDGSDGDGGGARRKMKSKRRDRE